MKKKTLLIALSSILISGLALGAGISYATYIIRDKGEQTFKSTAGERKKTIFLDCVNQWDKSLGEVFYAYFANNNDSKAGFYLPSKPLNLTLGGEESGTRRVFVYEYDASIYTKIVFTRCNPDGLTDQNVWEKRWNQTADIAYSSSVNYYKITSLNGNNCSYSCGTINAAGEVDYI